MRVCAAMRVGFALLVLGWNLWSARRHLDAARLRARRELQMAGIEP